MRASSLAKVSSVARFQSQAPSCVPHRFRSLRCVALINCKNGKTIMTSIYCIDVKGSVPARLQALGKTKAALGVIKMQKVVRTTVFAEESDQVLDVDSIPRDSESVDDVSEIESSLAVSKSETERELDDLEVFQMFDSIKTSLNSLSEQTARNTEHLNRLGEMLRSAPSRTKLDWDFWVIGALVPLALLRLAK